MYYECQLALVADTNPHPSVKVIVQGCGWTYGEMDGDPTLGPGAFLCATKHYPAFRAIEFVKTQLLETSERLTSRGIHVVRKRINLVLFDTCKEGV